MSNINHSTLPLTIRVHSPDYEDVKEIERLYAEIGLTYSNMMRLRRKPRIIEIRERSPSEFNCWIGPQEEINLIEDAKQKHLGSDGKFVWYKRPDGACDTFTDIAGVNSLDELQTMRDELNANQIKIEPAEVRSVNHWVNPWEKYEFKVYIGGGDFNLNYSDLEKAKEIRDWWGFSERERGKKKVLAHLQGPTNDQRIVGLSRYLD